MINKFLSKYSPPGMDLKQEKQIFAWGIILSILYSTFYYFSKYAVAYGELYIRVGSKLVLNTAATMPDFKALLGYSFIGFAIVSVMMVGFILYHYSYYRQGSMSLYLMKRLPKKFELHKRALALPIIGLLLCFVTVFVLRMVYFIVYILATPEAYLLPNQWQNFWRLF